MKNRLFLLLTLALCIFLRFYHLDGYGLWSDEFVTLLIVSAKSFKDVIQTCFEVPQPMPPLYFVANKWTYDFFLPGEIGLRALSAAASGLAGYFLFATGRTLFSSEIGSWSLLLFAVNSTQIVYAQNARPYAVGLMLSALSMHCFLKWRDQHARIFALAYVISTALLFYTHYIFFPLLLIQGLCLFMIRNPQASTQGGLRWKQWMTLQAGIAVLLLPLYPQLWRVVQERNSLNWESKYPTMKDFLMFVDVRPLLWGMAAWVAVAVVVRVSKNFTVSGQRVGHSDDRQRARAGLALLVLWYFVPCSLFFGLAQGSGLNLFVERYLVQASLPIFLALPVLALTAGPRWAGRTALWVYLFVYVYTIPGGYFATKRQFSQGVPGGNEWRETLGQLADPRFQSPLLLFQSPFIESNQLDFSSRPQLARYLSAPLHSFYVTGPLPPFVLLPVHWWFENAVHLKFKADLRARLQSHNGFTLLATQEFFDNFEPWLRKEAGREGEWKVVESFRSTGSLRLKRLGWISDR